MYNLLISLGAAVVVFGVFFGTGIATWFSAILPATIAFGALYFFLAKRTLNAFEAILLASQKDLGARRFDQGLAKVKEAFPLSKWQFFIAPQIHAQLGMVLYMLKRFDEAKPHLEQSFVRIGQARAMLAAIHFQNKDYPAMTKAFEEAVRHSKKDGFIWSIYAFCLEKQGETAKALDVLRRGLVESPGDEKMTTNQLALQNKERLRMKAYGNEWWAFHLEMPPRDVMMAAHPGQAQQAARPGYRTPPKQRG